jgi:hypothetical protein
VSSGGKGGALNLLSGYLNNLGETKGWDPEGGGVGKKRTHHRPVEVRSQERTVHQMVRVVGRLVASDMFASENLDAASTGDGTPLWEPSSEAEGAGPAPCVIETGRLTSGHWSRQQIAQEQAGASASDERLTVVGAPSLETDARPPMTPTSTKPVAKNMIIGRRLVLACLVGEEAEGSDNILYILAVHGRLRRVSASVTPLWLAHPRRGPVAILRGSSFTPLRYKKYGTLG